MKALTTHVISRNGGVFTTEFFGNSDGYASLDNVEVHNVKNTVIEPKRAHYTFGGWQEQDGTPLVKFYKTNGLNPHIGIDTSNIKYIYLNDIKNGNTYVPIWYDLEVPAINGVTTTVNLSALQTATVSASDTGSGIAGYYIGQTEPTEANYKNGSILFMPTADASYSKTVANPGTWYFAAIDKDGNWNYTSKKYHKIKTDMGTGEAASDIVIAEGTLPTPSRTGHTFDGWYADDGTRVTESTALADGTTIHARWTVNTYTLAFNANGGSCGEASRGVNYGSAYGTMPTPSRTGYTFNGWFTDPNGGTQVSAGTVMGAGDVTVYAHWIINNYTLIFNANGGNSSETSRTVTYNSAYGSLPSASRTGYTFNGWFTDPNGGSQVSAGTVMGAGNVTVYAHWTINSYTLTFDANGGSCGEGSRTVTYNSAYGTLPTPSKSGYVFTGWFTDATDGTQVSEATVMGAGNVTVYAHWRADTVTIEFIPGGPLWGNFTYYKYDESGILNDEHCVLTVSSDTTYNSFLRYNVKVGTEFGKLPEMYGDCWYHDGFVFAGWFTGENGSGTQITESSIVPELQQNSETFYPYLRLYAHYVHGYYTLTFDATGGTCSEASRSVGKYHLYGNPDGTDLNSYFEPLPIPSRTGYTFTGWYTHPIYGSQIDMSTVMGNEDTTVYAHWTPE